MRLRLHIVDGDVACPLRAVEQHVREGGLVQSCNAAQMVKAVILQGTEGHSSAHIGLRAHA